MATNRQIAEQVIAQANHLGQEVEGLYIPDIVKMIPTVIRELVTEIAEAGKPEDRKLFQNDFTIAIVTQSGFDSASLSTPLAASEPLFLHLPFPSVSHPDSQAGELRYVADEKNLSFARTDEGYDHYTVQGTDILINAEPELTGNLTVTAFYFPLMANIKPQFEQLIINKLLLKFGLAAQIKAKR